MSFLDRLDEEMPTPMKKEEPAEQKKGRGKKKNKNFWRGDCLWTIFMNDNNDFKRWDKYDFNNSINI